MAETPSAGSTTGIKSGFVGRKVWKEVSGVEVEAVSESRPKWPG